MCERSFRLRGRGRATILFTLSAEVDSSTTWCAIWSGHTCWWERERLAEMILAEYSAPAIAPPPVPPRLPAGCTWLVWSMRDSSQHSAFSIQLLIIRFLIEPQEHQRT